jgi:hypothetical protein
MTSVASLRLYSTALVLLAWAALWPLGVKGDPVIVVGLALTAVSIFVAERERARRRRGPR